jgi:hypothetical protein
MPQLEFRLCIGTSKSLDFSAVSFIHDSGRPTQVIVTIKHALYGKVTAIPCTRNEGVWGIEIRLWLLTFFTSAMDGGEWSASRPGLFTRKESDLWFLLKRRLEGPP